MAFQLATDVHAHRTYLSSINRARVVASAPVKFGPPSRLGLRLANKCADRSVGREADENMNVIGQHRLGVDAQPGPRGRVDYRSRHNVNVCAPNRRFTPPGMPRYVRVQPSRVVWSSPSHDRSPEVC